MPRSESGSRQQRLCSSKDFLRYCYQNLLAQCKLLLLHLSSPCLVTDGHCLPIQGTSRNGQVKRVAVRLTAASRVLWLLTRLLGLLGDPVGIRPQLRCSQLWTDSHAEMVLLAVVESCVCAKVSLQSLHIEAMILAVKLECLRMLLSGTHLLDS